MANPFATRATEYVRNVESFLSMISADPLNQFLKPVAKDAGLFSRLVTIQGTPGSGKTTIAKLFEFSAMAALLRGAQVEGYSDLISALQGCEAITRGRIGIVGCRLALESDYQEIWQLPYSEKVRIDLFQRLVQSRAVLAWFAQLQRSGIQIAQVSLEARENCSDLLVFVGGSDGTTVLTRAKAVEAAVYSIVGALIPPRESEIETKFAEPYKLFDSLEFIRIAQSEAADVQAAEQLRPLVILDDAHFLHGPQFQSLRTWLVRRELKVARWVLSRLDVLQPAEVFECFKEQEEGAEVPGITTGRDVIPINLQSVRREARRPFRAMAREICRKYLRQMDIFRDNDVSEIEAILPDVVESLPPSVIEKLHQSVRATAKRLKISQARVSEIEALVEDYHNTRRISPDVRCVMIRILLNRYAKRLPQQILLLSDELDEEPSKPLKADLEVLEGACIQLLHEFDRPYYVGFDAISDAATENTEMFLRLASHIVEAAENQLIKQKSPGILPREQHRLLRERAAKIITDWNFPEHRRVRRITEWIAEKCSARTLEMNAPLGPGANALGVPWEEFLRIGATHKELANVLKFAVAYNALTLVPKYHCKKRDWCLLELGGVVTVHHGFTQKRGGFVEGTLEQLAEALKPT